LGEEGLLVFEGDAKVAYVRPWLYAIHYYGKRVEAEKPVPQLGIFWGGWSQWRNRLPHGE
jgi:hypothetical protein